MNAKLIATAVVAIAAATGLLAIAGIVSYILWNGSGHTGRDPYTALALFVPVALAGMLHFGLFRNSGAQRWVAIAACLVGIGGVGLLLYLDQSNTLLQYEVWIQRGMP